MYPQYLEWETLVPHALILSLFHLLANVKNFILPMCQMYKVQFLQWFCVSGPNWRVLLIPKPKDGLGLLSSRQGQRKGLNYKAISPISGPK